MRLVGFATRSYLPPACCLPFRLTALQAAKAACIPRYTCYVLLLLETLRPIWFFGSVLRWRVAYRYAAFVRCSPAEETFFHCVVWFGWLIFIPTRTRSFCSTPIPGRRTGLLLPHYYLPDGYTTVPCRAFYVVITTPGENTTVHVRLAKSLACLPTFCVLLYFTWLPFPTYSHTFPLVCLPYLPRRAWRLR